MDIVEKIEFELYNYYQTYPKDPSGILLHSETFEKLYTTLTEEYLWFPTNGPKDIKFKGIKVYESPTTKVDEVKIIP